MPIKTQFETEDYLRQAALPHWGKTYTVIPHGDIIDHTRAELALAGFSIFRELYKTTQSGEVAQGIYHLNYGNDADMGLMFAWSNSYNKMMKFKCAVGAQVYICMNGMVSGDLASYARRHSGTALQDAVASIKTQISNAKEHYDTLIKDKEMLKKITLSRKQQSAIIGELYADQEILTVSQLAVVKREMYVPSLNYNAPADSAWSLYNYVTLSLKDSHPMKYLADHQRLHRFFVDQFGTLVTATNPEPTPDKPKFLEQELPFEKEEVVDLEPSSYSGVLFM